MKTLTLMLGAAALLVTVGTAEARQVKEVVGYTETVESKVYYPERDALFAQMDRNDDGVIQFREFQDKVILSNEYAIFDMNDTDNDGVLSLAEFRDFSKFAPEKRKNFN